MATSNAAAHALAPETVVKPRHPLLERSFRILFLGSTISLLGDQFYFVAMPWLVLEQTGSAVAMGTIMMTAAIPRALFMLIGGAVCDRVSPRKVMMLAAWARAVLVGTLGLLISLGHLHTWQLYALAGAFGTADAFDGPAGQALIPFLVQPEQLVAATSVSQVRAQMASIAGPAPAGFIIKGFGLALGFFLDAFSFLFLIGALLLLPDAPPQNTKKPIFSSILEGLQYVGKDVPLRSLMLVAVGINFCFVGPVTLGLAYVARTEFGSPAILGMLLTTLAGGALAGALVAGVWKIRHRGIMIILVPLVLGLLLGSVGMLHGRWALPAVLPLMGITAGMANVHIGAWIMQRIDAAVRGRVISVLTLGAMGTLPISLALTGFLIAVNLKLMFVVAGAVLIIVTMAAALQKTVRDIQ